MSGRTFTQDYLLQHANDLEKLIATLLNASPKHEPTVKQVIELRRLACKHRHASQSPESAELAFTQLINLGRG